MNVQSLKRTKISRSVRSILIGSGTALAMSTGGTALAAEPQDIEALKEQVRTLMDRIDELEAQQDASEQQVRSQEQELSEVKERVETAPANVITAGDIPGSFKIPGTDTSVSVSGYVKGDFIYDLDADVGDSFSVAAIPLDSEPEQDNVRLHARQSRVRVKSHTDLGNGGAVDTHIEGDFFGTGGNQGFANSTSFRIRHAYGQWTTPNGSSFAAGQTWTAFGGFFYMPTVDFFAPNGQVFLRQGQVRYTTPGGFAISLENPESFVADAAGESSGGEDDAFPDLVARWRGGPGGSAGNYSISGVVRELNGAGTGLDGVPYDDEATAWGVNVGGSWDFDPVGFTAGVTYGDGLGRYHLANTAFFAGVATGGEIETVEQLGVTAGLSLATTDTSSINVNVGYSERDDEFEALTPTADETGLSIHTNYIWSPWPGTNFGFEVVYGEREQYNGLDGNATRLQFGAQQSF